MFYIIFRNVTKIARIQFDIFARSDSIEYGCKTLVSTENK